MATVRPRKELDSKRLQDSLRANILTTVSWLQNAYCLLHVLGLPLSGGVVSIFLMILLLLIKIQPDPYYYYYYYYYLQIFKHGNISTSP